jgi:MFS family permease
VVATSLTRPAHASLLPSLAREPNELTSANVASGWTESFGILVGPAISGVMIAQLGPGAVFLLAAAIMAIGGFLVLGVRSFPDAPHPAAPALDLVELFAGFTALARLPGPRIVVLILGAAAALWGAIDVLNVAVAIDVMKVGPSGAGMLGASLGVGGIIGSSLAANLVGKPRIAPIFVVGLLTWGVPLIGIGFLPAPLVAVTLLIGAGAGRSVMDVAGRTLLQRASPNEVLSRIFGILEGIFLGAFGIGSIVVAGLIATQGARGAFVIAGLWLPVIALIGWRALRAVDAVAVVPADRLALLRSIPMFAPLPVPTIERLARSAVRIAVPAGALIIRQGDVGDRFYVLETGTVEISIDGRVLRTDGPGAYFGEIALLRDIPRTASVRAATGASLLVLDRAPFLEAVTGTAQARRTADTVVQQRLDA